MAQRGDLQSEDLIRRGKNSQWVLAHKVKGLLPTSGTHPTVSASAPKPSKQVRDRRPGASGAVVPLDDEAEEPLPVADDDDSAPALPVAQPLAKGAKGKAAPPTNRSGARPGGARPMPVPVSAAGPAAADAALELEMIANAAYSGAPLPGDKGDGSKFSRRRRKGIPPMVISLIGALAVVVALLIAYLVMNKQPAFVPKSATETASKDKATAEKEGKPEVVSKKVISGEQTEVKCCKDTVFVRVKAADAGYANFDESKGAAVKDVTARYLKVKLEIQNISQDKKLNYESWNVAASALGRPTMIDNHDNTYKFRQFPPGTIAGPPLQLESETLMPGKTPLQDVLLFEEPVLTAKDTIVQIELPTQAFGEPGTIDLNIPVARITVEPENPELVKKAKAAAIAAAREAAAKTPAGKKPDKPAPKSPEKAVPKRPRTLPPPADDDAPVVHKPKKPAHPDDPLPLDLDNTKGLPVPKEFGPDDHR
jgi:hypothetical protein